MGTIEMDQVVLVEAISDEGEGFDAYLMNTVELGCEGEGSNVDPMNTVELGCEGEGSNVDPMNIVESSEGEGFDVNLIHEHSV
jgi:hypothetical protein